MATIEIDGKTFEVENGKMIIEVADEAGIHIPRFCYHKKLSVAANCRMCLVEIENSKKTVPACATPISQGMKVFTQSAAALKSQKIVMEFLLINHPLDCPICDQGGECELQDVSMGFGADHSEFSETKRSVDDKNLGSLISTEMTRCIHCTRCVRFGEEIAGLREMGAPYRGEDVKIGTYIETSIRSEVSGNIIDLCPVGALTSKPFRFKARPWELKQNFGIAPHDCLGAHLYVHTRRGKLLRVIPKECESINETWLSDRDRFSYAANEAENRLAHPMIKQNGKWKIVDWSAALNFAVSKLGEVLEHHGPKSVAAFSNPSATTEEFYILQKWMRSLKVENVDFRLRSTDFESDKYHLGAIVNTCKYSDLELASNLFLIGTHLQREVPLAATRIRKAFLNGAKISSLNIANYQMPFEMDTQIVTQPFEFLTELAGIIAAMKLDVQQMPENLQKLVKAVKVTKQHQKVAGTLLQDSAIIVTGLIFENHPEYTKLRACLSYLTQHSSVKWIHLSEGANANGAWESGFTPHMHARGHKPKHLGMNAEKALSKSLKAYILHGVEPSQDFANPILAKNALHQAEFVLALSSFKTDDLLEHADVILPMASFGETSGTYVNVDGTWQSFEGCSNPFEQARPAWKIYRVLANLSHCEGFDYTSSQEILAELQAIMPSEAVCNSSVADISLDISEFDEVIKVHETSLYGLNMQVRASKPLQESAAADQISIQVHPNLAQRLNLGKNVIVTQGKNKITLPLTLNDRLHEQVVIIPAIGEQWSSLGGNFEKVSLQ